MGIDPNIHDFIVPVTPFGPASTIEEEASGAGIDWALLSTLSPSEQKELLAFYIMPNVPILTLPQTNLYNFEAGAVGSIVALKTSEIISAMCDAYSEHLAEQKERIADELKSPAYIAFLEQQSSSWIAKMEANTPLDTQLAIRSSSKFQEYLSSLPPYARDKELHLHHAGNLWNDFINGTASFIDNYRDEDSMAIPAIAVGFLISATFIGDYTSIVDVVSTNMVAVNPIQDAVSAVAPLMSPSMAEQATLVINLFITGIAYATVAEEVGRSMNSGGNPVHNMDFALAFADNVIDKITSGQVNYLLMALLVNTTEGGAPITEDRINQLAVIAQAVMIAIALAVLYKVESGGMTGQEFLDLLGGRLEPHTEQEQMLLKLLNGLKQQIPEESWNDLMEALGGFFEGNPSVEDILDPLTAYNGVLGYWVNPETRG